MRWVIKNVAGCIATVFLALIILQVFLCPYSSTEFPCIPELRLFVTFFLGYLVNWVLAWGLRSWASRKNKSEPAHSKSKGFKLVPLSVLSPDYAFADCFKGRLKTSTQRRVFIESANKINIALACLMGVLALLLPWAFFAISRAFFLARLISRVVEISTAFYIDVTSGEKKKSSLKPHCRIRLAINSYFEIIILYSMVYYSFGFFDFYREALFASTLISTFNYSFGEIIEIRMFFMVTQIIASLNLIVLSIATYISTQGGGR